MGHEYRGYDIEIMYRGCRISFKDRVVAKVHDTNIEKARHEIDLIIRSNEIFHKDRKDQLIRDYTKKHLQSKK